MLLFWLFAGLLAGGAALLILLRAARSERLAASGDDAVTSVYRRQLTEIDELAERGLLGPEEHRSARAEAARRLLGEADKGAARPAETPRASRRLILAAAVIAPLIALGGYLAIGSPWLPDQPFAARMTAWRRTDPARLSLPQMEALLQAAVARQPNDAQGLIYLARVQAAEGDVVTGARTLQKAARLAPGDARVWTALGEALAAQGQGEITPEARDAFERAAAIDPSAPEPHYFIGRAQIAAGQTGPGLDQWRLVLAALPAGDPRRAVLDRDIAEVARTGRLPAPPAQAAASGGAEQSAFIQSMVDRLAKRLQTQPDDPQGWARLIRAYGVLGRKDRQDAAVAEARRLFKDRPDALRTALAGQTAPAL